MMHFTVCISVYKGTFSRHYLEQLASMWGWRFTSENPNPQYGEGGDFFFLAVPVGSEDEVLFDAKEKRKVLMSLGASVRRLTVSKLILDMWEPLE